MHNTAVFLKSIERLTLALVSTHQNIKNSPPSFRICLHVVQLYELVQYEYLGNNNIILKVHIYNRIGDANSKNSQLESKETTYRRHRHRQTTAVVIDWLGV